MKSENWFENFFEHRSNLIKKYEEKIITKKEFLKLNYEYFVLKMRGPYININSYEKAMYNYQYYNAVAKYYRMLASSYRFDKKKKRNYNDCLNISNNYYDQKDGVILEILRLKDYKEIEGYYVECNSKSLMNTLVEIVVKDEKEAIFHTKSERIIEKLKEKSIFDENLRASLIDGYINERY